MDWIGQVISFSASLGLLISGLIWFQKKGSHRRNRFFALFLFLISLQVWKDAAGSISGFSIPPALYLALQGTCLFVGPTVYLYVRAMLSNEDSDSYPVFRHYRLGLIYITVVSLLVLVLPGSPEIRQYINPPIAITVGYTIMFAQLYHVLWYFQRGLTRLKLHAKAAADEGREFKSRISWLNKVVVVLITIVSLFVLPYLFFSAFGSISTVRYLQSGFLLALSIAINIAAIQSFNSPETVLAFPRLKYQGSKMSVDLVEKLRIQLDAFMAQNRPHLDSQLRLEDMARMMAVRPAYLSQVMNDHHGKNFSEFINAYRVREAQRILSEDFDQHSSMYEVALDSGFNSKATFNRVFKQATGFTPTAYHKQLCSEK